VWGEKETVLASHLNKQTLGRVAVMSNTMGRKGGERMGGWTESTGGRGEGQEKNFGKTLSTLRKKSYRGARKGKLEEMFTRYPS